MAFIQAQPDHPGHAGKAGHAERHARDGRYEIICAACGDNPDLAYSQVPAEIQHVRGPYPTFNAARDALRQHLEMMAKANSP
jgi:hypothetical protein